MCICWKYHVCETAIWHSRLSAQIYSFARGSLMLIAELIVSSINVEFHNSLSTLKMTGRTQKLESSNLSSGTEFLPLIDKVRKLRWWSMWASERKLIKRNNVVLTSSVWLCCSRRWLPEWIRKRKTFSEKHCHCCAVQLFAMEFHGLRFRSSAVVWSVLFTMPILLSRRKGAWQIRLIKLL